MSDGLIECYRAALGAMTASGPRTLLSRVQFEAGERGITVDVGLEALSSYLAAASLNDDLRKRFHMIVSTWDIAPAADEWTASTDARSEERRKQIYARLGIAGHSTLAARFDDLFPLQSEAAVVISDVFQPWYTEERRNLNSLYWPAYYGLLERKPWSAEALAGIDEATNQVVERLTDPYRTEARQAKGLVVGYVQSGKTANFAGVIAKSIDAGYRLIIVLTGTIDVLRRQTQRRIDMEIVGRENIIRGIDPDDPEAMSHVDYQNDEDWPEKFQSFGVLPSSKNMPDIIRLTGANFDYKSLKAGIVALEFEKIDKTKPLYAQDNLPSSSARVVIVKKNKAVLNKLARDLKSIKTPRGEIPALIIDDESDQASVNTSNPEKWAAGKTERTAINKAISDLLRLLPRAQYVGYTATPFANVFIDPSDTDDIFPKDFLISLPRPEGYMGVADFHDLGDDVEPEDRTIANSNELAFVRDATDARTGDPKLQECVDAFVLSGALKFYRTAVDKTKFKHHTMLAHESVTQIDHLDLATEIREIWRNSAYTGIAGLARLKELYTKDFLPVCRARNDGASFPENFDDLKPHIAATVARATELNDPVIIVNGDKAMASEEIDFDKRSVWRILVGGAKLSRGFTVEGLTISYYRRKTKQADTLMQMGRWFGFRSGFKDLVRLYIGRAEPDGPDRTVDLYEAFEAIVQDEEAFREQLRQYSEMVDGHPQITPRDIPPLVSQHLPWLKPAAANKMFNAELVVRRSAGSLVIPTGYPTDASTKELNFNAVLPLMTAASRNVSLVTPAGENLDRSTFSAFIGEVDTATFLKAIDGIKWITADYYKPDKTFLHEITDKVDKWVIIAPQTAEIAGVRNLPDIGPRTVFQRKLKPPVNKLWGEPTDRKHRPAAQYVSGNFLEDYGDAVLKEYRGPRTGAALIYPMAPNVKGLVDPGKGDIVLAVAWITPGSTNVGNLRVVQFRAKNGAHPKDPIVPAA
jgi:hypothetical protein